MNMKFSTLEITLLLFNNNQNVVLQKSLLRKSEPKQNQYCATGETGLTLVKQIIPFHFHLLLRCLSSIVFMQMRLNSFTIPLCI